MNEKQYYPVVRHIMHCDCKKINRGAGLGLKVTVMYQARGHEKASQWLEKAINRILFASW